MNWFDLKWTNGFAWGGGAPDGPDGFNAWIPVK